MAEPKGKPPHAGKRLTREDVLRLIEEHGGPEGLDLREADLREINLWKANLNGANLNGANLQGANLQLAGLEQVYLWFANLRQANLGAANLHGAALSEANLQGARLYITDLQAADLYRANLQGADLEKAELNEAHLQEAQLQGATLSEADLHSAQLPGANLEEADLRGADLRRIRLDGATVRGANFDGVRWGDYVLADERAGNFHEAAATYRSLKQRHAEAGMYDVAGEFHYREMEARRKLARQERRFLHALGLNLSRWLYGYGERPERVIGWAAAVVFGLAVVHWLFGTVAGGFLDALYYSAVSFPALGYGDWSPEPQGWAGRFLGAGESFLGVFMMALFLVTFTRKMTR